jgi:hypothetical protein
MSAGIYKRISMCPTNLKKQTILISGTPVGGKLSAFISFRIKPTKLTVKQAFLSDSAAANLSLIYCREITTDPLCLLYGITAQVGEISLPGTEFNVNSSALSPATYTFTIENAGVLASNSDLLMLVLEFSE